MSDEKRWMWLRVGRQVKPGEHVVLRRLDREKWLDQESGVEADWDWWIDHYIWCAPPRGGPRDRPSTR